MAADPARHALDYALADAQRRIDATTQGMLRAICAGESLTAPHVTRHRAGLEQALRDRAVVRMLVAALDELDEE